MLGAVIGWSPRILGTDIKKFANISCLNSHFLSQFMLKWSLYQHICLTAFVCYWCLVKHWKSPFITSHTTMMGLTQKCRSLSDGKPKYRWSVSMAFTVSLEAQQGAKIECNIIQTVRFCDSFVWIVSYVSLQNVLTVSVFSTFLL